MQKYNLPDNRQSTRGPFFHHARKNKWHSLLYNTRARSLPRAHVLLWCAQGERRGGAGGSCVDEVGVFFLNVEAWAGLLHVWKVAMPTYSRLGVESAELCDEQAQRGFLLGCAIVNGMSLGVDASDVGDVYADGVVASGSVDDLVEAYERYGESAGHDDVVVARPVPAASAQEVAA